jgi:light-regulated signal transduction histidine kinase (bacteriophytochrome)
MALLLCVLGVLLVQGVVVLRPALANIQQGISRLELAKHALQCKSEELGRSNAELEQFAYVASHDLQEPLRMVASYTQLLARRYRGKLDSDADEFIGFAVDGATRMQTLIRDLLSYSRIMTQGHALQPVDTRLAFDTACGNLQQSIEESRGIVSVGTLPTIHADATQLTQLFQNLLGNALKYCNGRAPQIHVDARAADNAWLFSVQDNGIGIEPQYFERIFQMFQRLHTREEYSGTGIGLAICRRIVERHGGRIWVESQLGRGSTFRFAIPRT